MPTLLIVQLGLGQIIRETETTADYDTRTASVVLDSFAMSACISAEEGTVIPVVFPRSVIHEDRHGVPVISDSLPSRPNDNSPLRP